VLGPDWWVDLALLGAGAASLSAVAAAVLTLLKCFGPEPRVEPVVAATQFPAAPPAMLPAAPWPEPVDAEEPAPPDEARPSVDQAVLRLVLEQNLQVLNEIDRTSGPAPAPDRSAAWTFGTFGPMPEGGR
jgi:hypothetical protein